MKIQEFMDISKTYLSPGSSRFEVKITQDEDELKQARKLRLNGYFITEKKASKKTRDAFKTKQLIDQHKLLIHDGYDSYARHLIVKDLKLSKVVAYVRIIDAFTAFKIGGYYCETQFNMQKILNNQQYHMEISRLVIDKEYDNEQVAQLIWSGISQYAFENGIDTIIGSLSIPLDNNMNETSQLILHYKTKHMSKSKLRVYPYQLLPDNKTMMKFNFTSKQSGIPYLDLLFSKGIMICGDAHWNRTLNTAELFIYFKVSNTQHIPHCIHMNEVELGLLCV